MENIVKFSEEMDIKEYFTSYVKPEEFIIQCEACPNFGKTWSCPPYDFDVRDFWQSFKKIKVVAYKIISDKDGVKMRQTLAEVKNKLGAELRNEEKLYSGSLSLAAGRCEFCDACSRPDGMACRFHDEMRYSIESLGGDVVKTLKDLFGIELQWMHGDSVPDYMVLVGGLLIKD